MKKIAFTTCVIGILGFNPSVNAEKCRVSPALGGYEVECRPSGSNVLNRALEYNSGRKSPLEMLRDSRRQQAQDQMSYQQNQMQQQLLQLEIQKQQLELERQRLEQERLKPERNSSAAKNAEKYCFYMAKAAGEVVEYRGKESWSKIKKALQGNLRKNSLPVPLKYYYIETLNKAYHSESTPREAFNVSEKHCLGQFANSGE